MFFHFDLTVPALTTKLIPVTQKATIVRGNITQASVFIPPGSNGLTHLQVKWGLHQLFPSNEAGDFSNSGAQLTWPEDIEIGTDPAELTLVAWNDDDTYAHTVSFSIAIKPSGVSHAIKDLISALASSGIVTVAPDVP